MIDLILCDGKTLTVHGSFVNYMLRFNVYGQTQSTGKLVVAPTSRNSQGMFDMSSEFTLHGGVIETDGSAAMNYYGYYGVNFSRDVTICGGKLIARGGKSGVGLYTYYKVNVLGGEIEAYDDLTDEQKSLVENYETLTNAEAKYAELKAAAETPENPEPSTPTDADEPAEDGACPICGKTHDGGVFDKLVGFIHSLIALFRNLFKGFSSVC